MHHKTNVRDARNVRWLPVLCRERGDPGLLAARATAACRGGGRGPAFDLLGPAAQSVCLGRAERADRFDVSDLKAHKGSVPTARWTSCKSRREKEPALRGPCRAL